MTVIPGPWPGVPATPRRRPPLSEPFIYRVRIDVVGATPPIWRRLEIHSTLSLWSVHRVIQGAFDWYDGHLYQFALGRPHDTDSELFLCDFDVAQGDFPGTSVDEVRIDETLQDVGDELAYVYDYGDDWHLMITLEDVRPAEADDPLAICTAGERAAPPEDSGGRIDAVSLAEVLEDPAFFDLADTNATIDRWLETPRGFAPAESLEDHPGFDAEEHALYLRFPQFKTMLDYTFDPAHRDALVARLRKITDDDDVQLPETQLADSFSAIQLLLDQVGDRLKLTAAGYLPPKLALRLAEELGLDDSWMSSASESQIFPVAGFRAEVVAAGLLRKVKGDLIPTKAGKAAQKSPQALFDHLATRLLAKATPSRTFAHDATLLTLLFAASSDGELDLNVVADFMGKIGWRINNAPPKRHHVAFQGFQQIVLLWFIAPRADREWFNPVASPVAVQLAKAALLTMKPATSSH